LPSAVSVEGGIHFDTRSRRSPPRSPFLVQRLAPSLTIANLEREARAESNDGGLLLLREKDLAGILKPAIAVRGDLHTYTVESDRLWHISYGTSFSCWPRSARLYLYIFLSWLLIELSLCVLGHSL